MKSITLRAMLWVATFALVAVVAGPTPNDMAAAAELTKPDSLAKLKTLFRRPETIPFPKDNPYTLAKAELGKKLYFDTRLSGANVLSCATCHNPAYGWGDGQPTGV